MIYPFKSKDECIAEMMNHLGFGFIKNGNIFNGIVTITDVGVCVGTECEEVAFWTFEEALNCFKFLDGKEFGNEN